MQELILIVRLKFIVLLIVTNLLLLSLKLMTNYKNG